MEEIKEEQKTAEQAEPPKAAPKSGEKKAKQTAAEKALAKALADLDAKEKELTEAKDKYLRMLAEYDNYRKRTQKEREGAYADGLADAVKEILPIIDNLERAAAVQDASKIAEGLALKMAEGEVPEHLRGRTLLQLDVSAMIAGAKYRGEFEDRLKSVIKEASENKRIILFIDEIHMIVGAGAAEGAVDAANILKPALARGELQVLGATTVKEYRQRIEKDAALERRFQPVLVAEPSETETVGILRGLREKYEEHHKITITDEAIEAAVNLSARYISDRFLPDKAIDLVDEAASKKRISEITLPADFNDLEEEIKKVSTGHHLAG